MARKYAIRDQDNFYFVTFTVIRWIDVFINPIYRDIFINSVRYCQREKGLEVAAWCIMSNHVHMILRTNGENRLQDIIRDLKSYTSRHIRKALKNDRNKSRQDWITWLMEKAGIAKSNTIDFQLWQHHNHPICLNQNFLTDSRLNYIHQNPVKQGWVENPEDWIYSSARDYSGKKGLVDIVFIN